VKAWTFRKRPARENPPCRAVEQKLVNLDKGRRLRHLGWRIAVTRPGRDAKRAEDRRLSHSYFERGYAARHFVQCRKQGNGIRYHRRCQYVLESGQGNKGGGGEKKLHLRSKVLGRGDPGLQLYHENCFPSRFSLSLDPQQIQASAVKIVRIMTTREVHPNA
jgi:hypothetical protein